MILPLGSISPDTSYPFPNMYGFGYGARGAARQAAVASPPRGEVKDVVHLSPAATRILDQAERLAKMSIERK